MFIIMFVLSFARFLIFLSVYYYVMLVKIKQKEKNED